MSKEKIYLLRCIECGAEFFTEGERDFYNSKGLNMPKRCKACRSKKKIRYEQKQNARIKNIVVIGHSLSDVDYPYFKEIIKYNRNSTEVKWYISWHSVDDLRRITRFLSVMRISNSNVEIFRT